LSSGTLNTNPQANTPTDISRKNGSIVLAKLGLLAGIITGGYSDSDNNSGVVQVRVDYHVSLPGSNKEGLQWAAMEAAKRLLGKDLHKFPLYDLVLFCMPPGTDTWVAYAFVNHKFSFYNNLWCSSVSSQMHNSLSPAIAPVRPL